jgi:hypothetical protein
MSWRSVLVRTTPLPILLIWLGCHGRDQPQEFRVAARITGTGNLASGQVEVEQGQEWLEIEVEGSPNDELALRANGTLKSIQSAKADATGRHTFRLALASLGGSPWPLEVGKTRKVDYANYSGTVWVDGRRIAQSDVRRSPGLYFLQADGVPSLEQAPEGCRGTWQGHTFRAEGCQNGTVLELGGLRGTSNGVDPIVMSFESQVNDQVASLPSASIGKGPAHGELQLPFAITLPDGTRSSTRTWKGPWQVDVIDLLYKNAKNGTGTTFGPTDSQTETPGACHIVDAKSATIIGSATRLRDIELVALTTSQKWVEMYCSSYYDNMATCFGLGCGRSLTLRLEDAGVTVYERRSGRVVGTRRFSASRPACPKTISSNSPGSWDIRVSWGPGSVQSTKLRGWVDSLLPRYARPASSASSGRR